MTSTDAVDKLLANLSRIPSNINSTSQFKNSVDIDEIVRTFSRITMMELKSRGIA